MMKENGDLLRIYKNINERFKIGSMNAHIISGLNSGSKINPALIIQELQKIATGKGYLDQYLDKPSIKDAEKFIKELEVIR